MACCSCCEKTGACCNDGVCSEETCADCESAGGVFQGVDTTCAGVGECDCNSKSCRLVADGWPTVVPEGTCQGESCCCEGVPEGGCFDESILDENGDPPIDANDWVLKAYCENCCENNKFVFSVKFPPNVEPPDGGRSQEWVENVRDHLLANGWSNATEYHFDCYTGGGAPSHLSYVRVCCDGTIVCPPTESEDCGPHSIYSLMPADSSNLQPVLSPNNCLGPGCLPVCEPNPLP